MLAQATRFAPTIRAWVNAAVMPLSLKLPEGFMPSYWSSKLPCGHADVLADLVGLLEQGLPLADGDHHGSGGAKGKRSRNRQTPEKLSGSRRLAHLRLEIAARPGNGKAVPVVDDVDQVAADGAREVGLVDGEGGPAAGMDALLEGGLAPVRFDLARKLLAPGIVRSSHPELRPPIVPALERPTGHPRSTRRDLAKRAIMVTARRPGSQAGSAQEPAGRFVVRFGSIQPDFPACRKVQTYRHLKKRRQR